MTPYLSLTEAADRVFVSTEWFLPNVVPELPSSIVLNGETSWLAADVKIGKLGVMRPGMGRWTNWRRWIRRFDGLMAKVTHSFPHTVLL